MKVTENKVNIPFTKLSLYEFVVWLKTFIFVFIKRRKKKEKKLKTWCKKFIIVTIKKAVAAIVKRLENWLLTLVQDAEEHWREKKIETDKENGQQNSRLKLFDNFSSLEKYKI